MSRGYEETITDLQQTWQRLKDNISLYRKGLGSECENLLVRLSQIGLDVSQDGTFSLIEPGLTRKEFDTVACRSWILQSLSLYHQSHATGAKYLGEPEVTKYNSLKDLLTTVIPKVEEYLARVENPAATVSALDFAEFNFLRNAVEIGLLGTAYKIAANDFAIEMARSIFQYLNRKDVTTSDCKSGLYKANVALEAIQEAQDCYTPREIHAEYNSCGGGFTPQKIIFSKEEIERAKEFFFFKEIGLEFEDARSFQREWESCPPENRQYPMKRPMCDIAEKLCKNGYDVKANETFEKFGTDHDTFWACCVTEREQADQVATANLEKGLALALKI